jgi:hypothetical protein
MNSHNDLTFVEGCRRALVGRWFQTNKPGGTAFCIGEVFFLGREPKARLDLGLVGTETTSLYDIVLAIIEQRAIPYTEEPEEDADES